MGCHHPGCRDGLDRRVDQELKRIPTGSLVSLYSDDPATNSNALWIGSFVWLGLSPGAGDCYMVGGEKPGILHLRSRFVASLLKKGRVRVTTLLEDNNAVQE